MDFGMQMAAAARLAAAVPPGGRAAAGPLPGGAARRVPGHRACAAGRAVGAVRRWGRRRAGADRGRRPDPVDLRLARRVGDQPAAVHHRLPARRRQPRARAGTARPVGATRRAPCTWPTRCPPRRDGGRWRCGSLRPRPGAEPGTVRCALLSDVVAERNWVADQLSSRYHGPVAVDGTAPTAAVLVRRNADAAPMAEALRARGLPVEVVGLAGSARRRRGRRRGGDAAPGRRSRGGRRGRAGAHRPAVATGWPRPHRAVAARRRTRLTGRRRRRRAARGDRCAGRPRRRLRLPGRRDLRSRAGRTRIRRRVWPHLRARPRN